MVDEITKFGIGTYTYDFTAAHIEQVSLPGGHGNSLPNTGRLLGLDGGYNLDGRDGARSAVGSTQATFQIFADGTLADMSQKVRALYEMQGWGEKRLFKKFADNITVWTWATVDNVSVRQRSDNLSYVWATAQIAWSTPKARWYGKSDLSFFDSGFILSDGLTFSTPKVDATSVGDGSTVDLTNNGNAYAGVYVQWDIPAGVTVTNPTITRQNELGQDVDVLTYSGTLSGDDVLVMDARNHQTTLNMVANPEYENVDAASGMWLQIPPGTTTLQISGTFSANANLTLDCWDTYY